MWRNRIFTESNSFLGNPSLFSSFFENVSCLQNPESSIWFAWKWNYSCFSSGIIVLLETEDSYVLPIITFKVISSSNIAYPFIPFPLWEPLVDIVYIFSFYHPCFLTSLMYFSISLSLTVLHSWKSLRIFLLTISLFNYVYSAV